LNPTLYILGSNSATPTRERHPTSQILKIDNQKIMLDCGEGTQNQLLKFGIRHTGITHICISHLHGDHYFGLIGLLSTMSLSGRKDVLHLIGPPPLKEIIDLQISYGGIHLNFEIAFYPTNPEERCLVTQTKSFEIISFPLKHRIHCTGFLINELPKGRHIIKSEVEKYNIPFIYYNSLKAGSDFTSSDGTMIPNKLLTEDPSPTIQYAFCSDTIFDTEIVKYIQNVDVLYHEATFMKNQEDRANLYFHSTAEQAAIIAKMAKVGQLIIGHFSSRYENLNLLLDESKTVFENTYLAEEGNSFEITKA
jgi:ribonuclease Z